MIKFYRLIISLLLSAILLSCSSTGNIKEGSDTPNWFNSVTVAEASSIINSKPNTYIMQYMDFYPEKNNKKYKIIKNFGESLGKYVIVMEIENIDNVEMQKIFHQAQKSLGINYENYDSPFIAVYGNNGIIDIY